MPSHDKRPEWEPPVSDSGSVEEWRVLNAAADEKAGQASAEQEERYRYAAWDDAVERADAWARYACERLHAAAAAYIQGDAALLGKLQFTLEERQ